MKSFRTEVLVDVEQWPAKIPVRLTGREIDSISILLVSPNEDRHLPRGLAQVIAEERGEAIGHEAGPGTILGFEVSVSNTHQVRRLPLVSGLKPGLQGPRWVLREKCGWLAFWRVNACPVEID